MHRTPTAQQILDLPLGDNPVSASTIREYLAQLLFKAWQQGEYFDGDNPFGDPNWRQPIREALRRFEVLPDRDTDERVTMGRFTYHLIAAVIREMANPEPGPLPAKLWDDSPIAKGTPIGEIVAKRLERMAAARGERVRNSADTARLITERLTRDLRAEADFLDEASYHATPAEDTAAAEALRAFADRLEAPMLPGGQVMNGAEFLFGDGPQPMPSCTPTGSSVEWAAQLTGHDGERRHQAGDEDYSRLVVDSVTVHLATLGEAERRAKRVERVDLVRRTVITYADGGQHTDPWTVVDITTKEN